MEYSPEYVNSAQSPDIEIPANWDERLARGISNLLSPPILAVAATILLASLVHTPGALWWIGYSLALTMVIPLIYLVWKVRRGEISDIHICVREQRLRPMALALAGAITALGSLWVGQAPRVLLIFSIASVAQLAFLLLITLRWKISGHGAAIGSLAVFLVGLYGSAGTPALLAIPLVAWARVRLQRHTPAQTIAGSLVGMIFTFAWLYTLSIAS